MSTRKMQMSEMYIKQNVKRIKKYHKAFLRRVTHNFNNIFIGQCKFRSKAPSTTYFINKIENVKICSVIYKSNTVQT